MTIYGFRQLCLPSSKGTKTAVLKLLEVSAKVWEHTFSDLFCSEQFSRFPGAFLASGEARRGEGEEAGSFPVSEKRGLNQKDIKQPRRVIWSRFAAFASCGPAGKTQLTLQST